MRGDRRLQLDAIIFHRLRAGGKDGEHRPRRAIDNEQNQFTPNSDLPVCAEAFSVTRRAG